MKAYLLFLSAAIFASAQTLSGPISGVVLAPNGRLELVKGIFSNLLPPSPAAVRGIVPLSAAFSATAGLIKTQRDILITDAYGNILSSQAAPKGPALFAFTATGDPAYAWLSSVSGLENLSSAALLELSSGGDEVIALGTASSGSIEMLVRNGSFLWGESVSTRDGSILRRTSIEGGPPAVAFESGWLVTSPQGLSWVEANQTVATRFIEVPEAVTGLQTSGPHSVAINGKWLLTPQWKCLRIPVPRGTRLPAAQRPQ